jgi:hypothetical protein
MRQEKPHCFGLSCSLLVLLTCVFLRHARPCKAQLSARNSCFTAAQGRPSYFFSSDIDRDISDLSDKRHERSTSIVDLPSLCCISIAKQRRTTKLRTAECRLQNDASPIDWYFGTLVERCKRPKGEQRNFAPLNADYTTTRHQLIDTSGHSCRGIHSDTLHGFVHEHFPWLSSACNNLCSQTRSARRQCSCAV